MIPVIDVGAAYRELKSQIDAATVRVFESGWYILGAEVEAFEQQFAQYCHAEHCVGLASGLDALILGLRALNIGAGDEVIVPSNTYIASWIAASAVGATVVPVEPDPLTHCIDPDRIEAAITSRTRCIMPVHLYGYPCDMDRIVAIARQHGLKIIEDAAQAHGAAIDGRPIGSHGDVVAWSFYPTKNLGAIGDAGCITTNDAALAERMRSLRNYGSLVKNENDEKGVNSRLDPVQAAILQEKLRVLDDWQQRRQAVAAQYDKAFADLPIDLPQASNEYTHAWHLYVIGVPDRDRFAASLQNDGVASAVHYPIPPFRQKAYPELLDRAHEWPIADRLADRVLSIPMSPHLSASDIERVISAVRKASDDIGR